MCQRFCGMLAIESMGVVMRPRGPSTVSYPCISYVRELVPSRVGWTYSVRQSAGTFFRMPRWPLRDWYMPGGILDASGNQFEVLDLLGWQPCPAWVRPLDDVIGWAAFRLLIGRRFQLQLGPPQKLTLDQVKTFIGQMLYVEPTAKVSRADREIEEATRHKLEACRMIPELIEFVDWFQRSDGGRVV